MSAALLASLLKTPARAAHLSARQWNGVIAAARAERLLATLALRLDGALRLADDVDGPAPMPVPVSVPAAVAPILRDARFDAQRERAVALWEADRAGVALRHLNIPVILMKGTAYVAANISAGQGRLIGDLDIMVPADRLDEAEAALLAAGWEWVKPDPYDDAYYRQWMHELPPLIHRDRDRMIDVHHTILPLTARQTPDAAAMIAGRVEIGGGLSVFSPEDRVCHAVAHLFADGDLSGGLRNLWDIYCLLDDVPDRAALARRAALHGLAPHLARAERLSAFLFGRGEPVSLSLTDRLFVRRLLCTDEWGRDGRKILRQVFYVRSHWLRMPPLMLARHLWTKWRKGHRPV